MSPGGSDCRTKPSTSWCGKNSSARLLQPQLAATATLQGRGGRAVELFDLLNPILLANAPENADRYRVEPYAIAADVYSQPPHTGRGGWTWYTGSASWMYRVVLESILGISINADRLQVSPSISPQWPGFEVILRRPNNTTWRIVVNNPHGAETGVRRVACDGREVHNGEIQLFDDGKEHLVEVEMGPAADKDRIDLDVARGGSNYNQPDRRADSRKPAGSLPP